MPLLLPRPIRHLGAGSVRLAFLALVVMPACRGPAHTEMSERARGFLEDSGYGFRTIQSRSARIHYLENAHAGRDPSVLVDRVEGSVGDVLRELHISEFRPTLDVFYVSSRDEMERLTGFPVTGMSYSEDYTVALVFNETWRAFEDHEIAHVVSQTVWGEPGPPKAPTLEGLAVYVDGECGGYPIGRVVRTMYDRRLLLDLDRLLGSFRVEDDLVAYLQAGSLFGFIEASGGIDAVREVWEAGLAATPRVLGLKRAEFEGRWLSALEADSDPVPDEAWRAIRAEGCGIDAASARDASIRGPAVKGQRGGNRRD